MIGSFNITIISTDSTKCISISGRRYFSYNETSIPTEEQKDKMKQTLLKYQEEESSLSYKDFIEAIFIEQGIVDEKVKEALLTALSKTTFDRFDKEQTVQFIDINKKFY